jgi:dTDP-4-amino-4,6-dideoxygalactose transaminase
MPVTVPPAAMPVTVPPAPMAPAGVRVAVPPADVPLAPPADVPIASPWLPPWEEVVERFEAIWRGGRLTNGACVERLESETAAYLGVPDCVAVSSCTAGLLLVARCLQLHGEVILPSFTFFATGHALLWNGLTPVFGDCDPQTFNLDPDSVARAWTREASAIVAVHIFGCPADVEALQHFARRRGLRLVFDGAHAFGARAGGKGVAAWGDATVFSLAATKPLVAGEGGLIATTDPDLARRLRQARNYGNDGSYDCPILGLNARMTELQAAVALAGLPYVEQGIGRRRRLAALYRQLLAENAGLGTQQPPAAVRSSWNGFALRIGPQAGIGRETVEQSLAAAGIETRRYYDPPLHRQKLYRRFYQPAREPLAATNAISSQVVSLPLHAGLEPQAVARIARQVVALERRGYQTQSVPTGVYAR